MPALSNIQAAGVGQAVAMRAVTHCRDCTTQPQPEQCARCCSAPPAHTAPTPGQHCSAHPALQHALTTASTVITNHRRKITADTIGH